MNRYTGQSTWEYVFNRYIYRSVTNEREYNERQMMIRVKNKIDQLQEENEYLRNKLDRLESESKVRIEDNIKKLYNEGYLSLEDILKASWYEQRKVIDQLKDDIRLLKEEMSQNNEY